MEVERTRQEARADRDERPRDGHRASGPSGLSLHALELDQLVRVASARHVHDPRPPIDGEPGGCGSGRKLVARAAVATAERDQQVLVLPGHQQRQLPVGRAARRTGRARGFASSAGSVSAASCHWLAICAGSRHSSPCRTQLARRPGEGHRVEPMARRIDQAPTYMRSAEERFVVERPP